MDEIADMPFIGVVAALLAVGVAACAEVRSAAV
jgi:hypothetical protein